MVAHSNRRHHAGSPTEHMYVRIETERSWNQFAVSTVTDAMERSVLNRYRYT